MKFLATLRGLRHEVEVRAMDGRYAVSVDGRSFEVDYLESADGIASLLISGRSHDALLERTEAGYAVTLADGRHEVALAIPAPTASRTPGAGEVRLQAPMPGKVVRVLVEPGQVVAAHQGLVVVEAMKMENELRCPRDGTVKDVRVREGQAVEGGALLVVVE